MSLGRPNGKSAESAVPLLSSEQYRENMQYLDHLQARIDHARAVTNAGRERAAHVQQGLKRMAEDGKTAEQLLAAMNQAENNEQILTMLSPNAIDYVTTPRPSLLSPTPPRPQLTYTQSHTAHMQAQHSNYLVQSSQSGHHWPANHSNYGPITVAPVSTLSPLHAQSSQSPVVIQNPTADAQLAHARPAKVSQISSLEGALGKEGNQSAKTAQNVANAINSVGQKPTHIDKPHPVQNSITQSSQINVAPPRLMNSNHSSTQSPLHTVSQGGANQTIASVSENRPSLTPTTYRILHKQIVDWMADPKSPSVYYFPDPSFFIQRDVMGRFRCVHCHDGRVEHINPDEVWHRLHLAGIITQWPPPKGAQSRSFSRLNDETRIQPSSIPLYSQPSTRPSAQTHQTLSVPNVQAPLSDVQASQTQSLSAPNVQAPQTQPLSAPNVQAPRNQPLSDVQASKTQSPSAPNVQAPQNQPRSVPNVQAPQNQPLSVPNVQAPQNQPPSAPNVQVPQNQHLGAPNGNASRNQSSMAPDDKTSIKSNEQALQNHPSTSGGKAPEIQLSAPNDKASTNDSTPSTPRTQAPRDDGPVRSPQDANKKTLARDILRALTKPVNSPSPLVSASGKRRISSVSFPTAGPAPKKRAVESRQNGPWQVYQPFSATPYQPTTSTWARPTATYPGINPPNFAMPVSNPAMPTSSQFITFKPVMTNPSQATTATSLLPPSAIPNTVVASSLVQSGVQPLSRSSLAAPSPANAVKSDTESLLDSRPNQPDVQSRSQSAEIAPLTLPLLPSAEINALESERKDLPLASTVQSPRSPSRARTPLFLPSPSPIASPIEGPKRPRYISQNRAYVDIPTAPDWVKSYQRRRSVRTHQESLGMNIEQQHREATLTEVNTVPVDPKEKHAIEESFSRLRVRRCEWKRCGVVLNSANGLVRHLADHEEEQLLQKSFTCGWHQCGKQFLQPKDFHIHLERHARNPIYCPYSDCEASFRTGHQLVQHTASHRADRLRPDTRPTKLPQPDHMPDIFGEVPAYMVEARAVAPCSISPARHQALGRWVLRNIFAPLEVPRRYNAAKPLRSSVKVDADTSAYDYEFLAFSSTYTTDPSEPPRKIKDLCNLNSSDVSQMAYEGLVLWPSDVKVEEVEDSQLI